MEIILKEKIHKVGDLGQQVSVKSGYARNYLIPKGYAVPATKKNIELFESQRAELEKLSAEKLAEARARADKINALGTVTLAAKAGEEGKLFGSIGTADVAHLYTEKGVPVTRQEVRMPHGNLRNTGEFSLHLHLHSDVTIEVIINIVAE